MGESQVRGGACPEIRPESGPWWSRGIGASGAGKLVLAVPSRCDWPRSTRLGGGGGGGRQNRLPCKTRHRRYPLADIRALWGPVGAASPPLQTCGSSPALSWRHPMRSRVREGTPVGVVRQGGMGAERSFVGWVVGAVRGTTIEGHGQGPQRPAANEPGRLGRRRIM